MRMRGRVLFVVFLLAAAGFHLAAFPTTYACGGFELTVRVSSTPTPPRAVSCQTFNNRSVAEFVVENLLRPEPGAGRWATVADPFAGEPLTVLVPVSTKSWMGGLRWRRMQFEYLVVIAVLPDGRQVGKVVDIPDGRVSREVSVEVP